MIRVMVQYVNKIHVYMIRVSLQFMQTKYTHIRYNDTRDIGEHYLTIFILYQKKIITRNQNCKTTTIRRTAVRDTGVSWGNWPEHHSTMVPRGLREPLIDYRFL